MTAVSAVGDARVLWLAMVQRLMGRAAHDVKDALNGVAVNLEVIRSRSERDGAPASAVAPFANAAAQQLERLTSLLEALLAVARSERDPVDVVVALRRIATLCAISGAAGGTIEVDGERGGDAITALPGEVVRLALAAPLLEVMSIDGGPSASVRCGVHVAPTEIHVTLTSEGRTLTMPLAVADVVRGAGVRWGDEGQSAGTLSLAFPRA